MLLIGEKFRNARPRPFRKALDRPLHAAAITAAVLAIVYAVPHLWWGWGASWLAPAGMDSDEGLGSHPAITFFAFYGMGALALLSAYLTWDMVRAGPSRLPSWFLGLHGWAIGILLLIRGGIGLIETTLVIAGARECPFLGCTDPTRTGRDSIGLTGMFWEPLFVIWGVALLTTVVLWTRMRGRP